MDSSNQVGPYTSIALDTSGKAHISYYDFGNRDLKYTTNATGTWVTSTLDSSGDVGEYTSLALDSSGNVHISYYDDTNFNLKYATNATGTWVTTTVDISPFVGLYTSIALDTSGKAHISYSDDTNNDLKYATNATGSWVTTTADSDGEVGRYTSIALDASGNAHISYADNTNLDLKYATNSLSGCTYSITSASKLFGTSGGTDSVGVTATSGCSWTASSNDSWITVTSGNSSSGNGTVNYSISGNTGISLRTGTITIAEKTFTVNQSGTACTYSITSASKLFGTSGGTDSVGVTATSGCRLDRHQAMIHHG